MTATYVYVHQTASEKRVHLSVNVCRTLTATYVYVHQTSSEKRVHLCVNVCRTLTATYVHVHIKHKKVKNVYSFVMRVENV